MNNSVRHIPPVDDLQKKDRFQNLATTYQLSTAWLTKWLKEVIATYRQELLQSDEAQKPLTTEQMTSVIFDRLQARCHTLQNHALRTVINGTGVVLHTNLGRARLGDDVAEAVKQTAKHYTNVEYDIAAGRRGSRHEVVEALLCEWTGAEAAMVVNNNAAAVYIILRALAREQEVIVSRGELVEIGGSFRISSIMAESDAWLKEVGTTNKTHAIDYEDAMTHQTALLMKVHTSNFHIRGFTEDVDTRTLADLAEKQQVVLYEDLGSGAFVDFRQHQIGEEPFIKEEMSAGVHIASMSGDKLLGGPQAGIIVGKKTYIEQLKKHQLARVLRVDKMTLTALEATLKQYLQGDPTVIPTVRDILEDASVIRQRAQRFIDREASFFSHFSLQLASRQSQVGGGTMPDTFLPTWGIHMAHDTFTAQQITERLRQADTPVITNIHDDKVFLDFRTIADDEFMLLAKAIRQAEK